MSNIKKTTDKTTSAIGSQGVENPTGKIVNIDKKINLAIEKRLSGFVKEIQEDKAKQKKLEAYKKACSNLGSPKIKKKKKGKNGSKKLTKK